MDTPPAPPEPRTPAPPSATAPPRRRTRRRGLGGVTFQAAVMAGLAWLTYANATGSRALGEALDAEGRGDYPTALRAATDHLARRPWGREASRVAARCLSRLDFAEEAEPYYRRGGDLTLADLRYRAYGLTRANLRDRALEAFGEVLRRRPDDIASLRLEAGVLLSMARWNDVAEIGRRLSGLPPGPATVDAPVAVAGHWTLRPMGVASVAALGATLEGLARHNQGEVEAAVAAYETVLRLDPGLRSMPLDRRLFWSQFGSDLLSMGRAAAVIQHLGLADQARSDPVLVDLLARAYTQQGAMDDAESCWRRLLELSPDHPAAWLGLGRIELGRGHLEGAARLLTRAAALAPESFEAAYHLGITHQRLGHPDEARRWDQEAIRLRRLRDPSRDARVAAPGGPPVPPTP